MTKSTDPPVTTTALAIRNEPPVSLADVRSVGELMATSGLFGDRRGAAQAAVKILAGREMGLGAFSSMTGIYLVQGRLCFSANTMAAILQATDRFKFRVKSLTRKGCDIAFFERDEDRKWEEVGTSSFDEEDAKLAGLAGGVNYKKYPRNMYFARAMANGCRWYAPAAFRGSVPYLPDELDNRARADSEGGYVVDAEVVQTIAAGPAAELVLLAMETSTAEEVITKHYGKTKFTELNEDEILNAVSILKTKRDS